jgi:hypothetical protein
MTYEDLDEHEDDEKHKNRIQYNNCSSIRLKPAQVKELLYNHATNGGIHEDDHREHFEHD